MSLGSVYYPEFQAYERSVLNTCSNFLIHHDDGSLKSLPKSFRISNMEKQLKKIQLFVKFFV